jgi:hypothetical protein
MATYCRRYCRSILIPKEPQLPDAENVGEINYVVAVHVL